MSEQKQHKQEVKLEFPAQLRGGVYCNLLQVTHTKEEFILDFMMVTPPIGAVVSRVVMSPGHMKRTILALQGNLQKYESKFGGLVEAPLPVEERHIGYKTA